MLFLNNVSEKGQSMLGAAVILACGIVIVLLLGFLLNVLPQNTLNDVNCALGAAASCWR